MDKKPVDDSDNRPEESTCPEDMTAPAEHAEKVEAAANPEPRFRPLQELPN